MSPPSGRPMMIPSGVGLWSGVFGDAERPALAGGADSGSDQRFAMFAEVRRRLAQAARPGGLLLVLDDLQWADEASAVLLADVVRQLRGTLILVLATYRESAASDDDTSAGLLPRLSADANTERVDLRGLPAGAVGDMLLAAGLPASADQAGQVHSETGGNPFLVRELARMLAEQRRGGPVPVPGRVADATAHRLAQLSDPARALVQTAAVAGNSFSAGVVARMLDVPVLALLGPLDECRAAGFLVAGDRPGDHRFSHALVRSAVAARLSAAEQRRLHAAAADAIEALYEGQLDLHLAEVARHRVEASLPGDRTRGGSGVRGGRRRGGGVAGVRGGRAPVPAGAVGRRRGDRRGRPLPARTRPGRGPAPQRGPARIAGDGGRGRPPGRAPP